MLEIKTKPEGAELISIKKDGEEKLHDGKEYWNRQAPILFPIVGKLKEGKTIIENQNYEMGQHGFARDMKFELVKNSEDSVEYKLESNEETLKKYPYQFLLTVKYQVKNDCLAVSYEVENKDNKNIFFGIGAHPAFKCDYSSEKYYLEFEKQEDEIGILELEDGLIAKARLKEEIIENNKIYLKKDSFEKDAIIMQNLKSNKITLKEIENQKEILEFDFTGFPYLAIWSKKGAPFVCIEPWYNTADYKESSGIFEEKKKIIGLNPKEKFKCKYKIKFF
ncbi:MAG: aldose 1-epimerase family protein [Clostridia bacterium]|jgi:galactose mutarotase-like enzyme|nr:aldose 1-epimerase family protein [Clostridia bacterium]